MTKLARLSLIIIAALMPLAAHAACVTTTVIGPDGKLWVCQTCCVGTNCTVICS